MLTAEPLGVAGVGEPAIRWSAKVSRVGAFTHGLPEVAEIKAAKQAERSRNDLPVPEGEAGVPKSLQPLVGANFEANWSVAQTPPDNSMAISNGGSIVTANNDEVLYMNTSGTVLQYYAWHDFFNDPQLNANIYDPKVVYDSQADRFIMTVLHGSTAANSIVLLCFSQSNNPTIGWWVYSLPGNVLQNNTWFDYPGLGVSTHDVFITGNMFTSGNNQFNQALVFQVAKAQGYVGQSLNYLYWSNLSGQPYAAFTLQPAGWGHQGNSGPGMLFVSSSAGGASTIRIWQITNAVGSNPQMNAYTSPVPAYAPGANANQMGTNDLLDTGDSRILAAFFLGDRIHFVHHADIGGTWNGIRYGRTNVNDLQTQTANWGNQGTSDLAYPALAAFSNDASDPGVMMAYVRSSPSLYPEARVVYCDQNLTFSNGVLVKQGETFVNFQQGNIERWGDYTGMARRHNAPTPKVWMAACYGAHAQGSLNNTWKTWVAEIGSIGNVGIEETGSGPGMRVFPNPVTDHFQLRFMLQETTALRVEIIDARGAMVKLLHEDTRKPGEYLLTFNRGALTSGTYQLVVRGTNTIIGHETIVVQ
ncbi:MAG: T9SS type A sorting domain-containing protein [Flavobacteriales bacterium]|nr:T9SS type A sorting domain-containing protein [Flavobacteriales bacterium]